MMKILKIQLVFFFIAQQLGCGNFKIESAQANPYTFSCEGKVSSLVLDSVVVVENGAEFYFTDIFPVPSWDFCVESIYLWLDNGCFNANEKNDDELHFFFDNQGRVFEFTEKLSKLHSNLIERKRLAPSYTKFLNLSIGNTYYREAEIVLRQTLGEALNEPGPKVKMYFFNIYPFLLGGAQRCLDQKMTCKDLEILKLLEVELNSNSKFQFMVEPFHDLNKDCECIAR